MRRVVPSEIVNLIDKLFPWAKGNKPHLLTVDYSDQAAALIDLVDQIPSELFVLDSDRYAEFVSSRIAVLARIQKWRSPDRTTRMGNLASIQGLGNLNPVTMIRKALAECPDESTAVGTAELSFINDNDLRESLRRDISVVNSALANGEWKASTVLAGSVVEALLLWTLQQSPLTNVTSAAEELVDAKTLKRKPSANLEDWFLPELIEVAAHLEVIKDDTAIQTRLAKNYRNLIHPGRTQRLGQICDRGTALAATAALERVVTDISQRK